MTQPETRARLQVADAKPSDGGFRIVAITAGAANGWDFPSDTLRASLSLWDRAPCFVDHGAGCAPRSVRDLAGVLESPAWDEEAQGIGLWLRPSGPAGAFLEEVGRQVLAQERPSPVGFSADLSFVAQANVVAQITRIHSVDLVVNPARGGAFIAAAPEGAGQSKMQGGTIMEETLQTRGGGPDNAAEIARLRQEVGGLKVEAALTAARLPAPLADTIRQRFAGRDFAAEELEAAVTQGRELVAALGGAPVVGPRLTTTAPRDQLQAAVDDLLGAPRSTEMANASVHRLTGIRELYMMLTGDHDLHGGFYADRARLATTADFTGLVKNALNKVVVNQWDALGRAGYDWWNRIATIEHFSSVNSITGTLVGTVGALPAVAEGGEYTELVVGDSPETASFTKYGGYIPLTLELIDRDETRKLRAYPRELANAGLRKISALVAAIFTDNAGVGPTMADTGALFNATAVTTAGGHGNLLTTALSAAQWDTVSAAVFNQPSLIKNAAGYYGTGPKQAINPRFCLVPRALYLTAAKTLYPTLENNANIYSENQQQGKPGDVIVVPEWTDATDWAAACDPVIAPAIFIGERFGIRPEVFIAGDETSPAVFANDEHRLKVRHFLAVWVNDFRPLHKSNVAA